MKIIQKKIEISPYKKNEAISYGIVILGFLLLTVLNGAGLVSNSLQGQLVPICAYIVMAVSLNLVVGISGELSLGHAGFMSVGAFTGIVISSYFQEAISVGAIRLCIAILGGALMGALFGLVIGASVLRLRGDYLAIVTLAFGQIIQNILNILYVYKDSTGIHFTTNGEILLEEGGRLLLNGPMGATSVQKIATFTAGFILVMVTLFVVQNLMNSRQGRSIMAIRDNRIAAESIGLDVMKYKMMAFVTSAALAGMAGALFGLNYSTLLPNKFSFNTSVLVLVFVVLGGIGNIWGSVIAATILTVLPEALRDFADYRMLAYAVVLILVMIFTYSPKMKNRKQTLKHKLVNMKKGVRKVPKKEVAEHE